MADLSEVLLRYLPPDFKRNRLSEDSFQESQQGLPQLSPLVNALAGKPRYWENERWRAPNPAGGDEQMARQIGDDARHGDWIPAGGGLATLLAGTVIPFPGKRSPGTPKPASSSSQTPYGLPPKTMEPTRRPSSPSAETGLTQWEASDIAKWREFARTGSMDEVRDAIAKVRQQQKDAAQGVFNDKTVNALGHPGTQAYAGQQIMDGLQRRLDALVDAAKTRGPFASPSSPSLGETYNPSSYRDYVVQRRHFDAPIVGPGSSSSSASLPAVGTTRVYEVPSIIYTSEHPKGRPSGWQVDQRTGHSDPHLQWVNKGQHFATREEAEAFARSLEKTK